MPANIQENSNHVFEPNEKVSVQDGITHEKTFEQEEIFQKGKIPTANLCAVCILEKGIG